MRGDEVVVVDSETPARVHHLVGGRGERHRAAEPARQVERQQHVLLLQCHVGERDLGHLALEDKWPAIAKHRRRRDALEHGIDRDLARDPAFLGERDRLAEGDDLDHQQEIDRDLHLAGAPAGLASGEMVLMSMHMPSWGSPARTPSGPSATARTAPASVTMEKTMSDFSATARGVAAHCMPAAINSSALSRERFQPVTRCPASMSRRTISRPMAPSPTNPTFMQ